MTQEQRVMQHLMKYGSITSGYMSSGMFILAHGKVIMRLRRQARRVGADIITEQSRVNQMGTYYLVW